MALLLYRLGHWCVRRRRYVLVGWLALLVVVALWAKGANGTTTDALSIPGTESQRAADLLSERFPAQSGATMRIAVEAPAGSKLADVVSPTQLDADLKQLATLPNVVMPADPTSLVTVSPDGQIAFIEVRFDKPAAALDKSEITSIISAVRQAAPAVLKVAFSGDPVSLAVQPEAPPSELIGFVVAVIVLLLTFGSVVAMGLPLLTALIGVVLVVTGISLLSAYTDLTSVAPTLAVMIGLAVGIDYALFIVTRHRAFHAGGLEPAEAAARANATSGGAVVFAGSTVVIALVGLAVVGIPFLTVMGLCAAAAVAIAVLIAITLVPAMLGFAGANIDRLAIPGIKVTTGEDAQIEHTFSGRFAKRITDRPWPFLVAGIIVIAILALPLFAIRLGLPDDGTMPEDTTQRQAYDILSTGFGPGFNGPLSVVVDVSKTADHSAALSSIAAVATADPDVALVAPPIQNQAGDTAIITVIPKSGPASSATETLVHHLRDGLRTGAVASSGAVVYVAGQTAANIDISAKLGAALPRYMAFVIVLTMVLLLVVFRSILVPIKAAVAILLSIGARPRDRRRHLPVGLGRRTAGDRHHPADRQLRAADDVRDPVRPVDGLRGVPPLAHPRGVRPHRQPAPRRPHRPVQLGPRDHCRRADHDLGLRRLRPRRRRRHQDVRHRPRRRRAPRRHRRADGHRAGRHDAVRPPRLVAPALAEVAARPRRRGGQAARAPPTPTADARTAADPAGRPSPRGRHVATSGHWEGSPLAVCRRAPVVVDHPPCVTIGA